MKASMKNDKNGHQSDDVSAITEVFGLIVCIKPEDDVPHPRHLCFKYPFNKTSPKRHCIKCYCYVCEEIAPCKKWSKAPQKHCQATENDECWRLQRKLIEIQARHKISVTAVYEPPGQAIKAFAGVLICNSNGDWISGFALRIHNNIAARDCSVSPYIALLEGLRLSWDQGFRNLDVHLGYSYHVGFWSEFKKNDRTKKYQISVDARCVSSPRIWELMKDVEDYLNREWFINIRNSKSFKEEAGSFVLAVISECQAEVKKVFNFTTYHLTAHIIELSRKAEHNIFPYCANKYASTCTIDEMKYFGSN